MGWGGASGLVLRGILALAVALAGRALAFARLGEDTLGLARRPVGCSKTWGVAGVGKRG